MPPFTEPDIVARTNYFLAGAATLGYFIAALFFLNFLRRTRDRLYLFFGSAFALMGAQRIAMLIWSEPDERETVLLYGLRLVSYLLILAAIIDKNRAGNAAREGRGAVPLARPSVGGGSAAR